ncbi:MAG: hypothetical protein E7463_08830 [Ruminococcaceae bacterium]|nr:hypothetical protein [Oscillospiraceae bacterium]
MKKYSFSADPFSRAFLENRHVSMPERVALGMLEAAHRLPITFPENCMLPTVGVLADNGAVSYSYGGCISVNEAAYDRLIAENPALEPELTDIREQMRGFDTGRRVVRSIPQTHQRLWDAKACWGGTWSGHANPDYDRFLHLGTNGIRALIEECRAKNPGNDGFYDACRMAMDSLDIVGDRIRAMALEKASSDAANAAEWSRIASDFARVPREPAFDMHSATQMFWMYFTLDGVDSPGRYDQFMIDYYRVSPVDESRDMVRRFLEGMHNVRGWNVCISGSDEHGNDETNELSYLVLELVTDMGYQTPNLTMRVHKNTPDALMEAAARCIATGIGLPALYNDEVVCPALEAIGIPPEDSHDYCMNGCNQIDIMGKSHMGLEDGEVNFAKVLEFTLHNGYDFASGGTELISNQYGDPRDCRTFEAFLALFYRQLDYITDVSAADANIAQEVRARFAPNPMRSCLIQGCLEKGRDYRWGGPLYGHGQVLAEGIADAADSLYAIKTLVYDQKKYTMDQLIQALEDNFEGHAELHRDCKNCAKFGNDIADVDELCAAVVDHFFAYLKTKSTFRGGIYTGGCSPFNRASGNGLATGALPNGRCRGDANFADSIAAVPGCDRRGPTASLKSMMHYRQREAGSGFVAQLKFDRSLFCTEKGLRTFVQLARTYFDGGGQQLSINVLDRDTLLAAQKDPDAYPNLVVRVGGYSDYFRNLSPELRQNVIDRSSFEL